MKTTLYILALGLLATFISCDQRDEAGNNSSVLNDTIQTKFEEKNKVRLGKRRQIEDQRKIDSLRLDKVLIDALKIATQNIRKGKFHREYEASPDSAYAVRVEIGLDNCFTTVYPHLIIRRNGPDAIYIDIYTKKDNKFEKVVSHEQWALTYVGDTIRDINGDGLKDFVVNWHGSNGCCLKAFSNVYLIRQDKRTFSDDFEFINPTFSPKEKIIRGICYGHPGETKMYKYQWVGENVDTLEYVFYEKNESGEKTGKIITSNTEPYDDKFKLLKRLNNSPKEYKEIEGYDWFTGKADK